MLKIKDSVDLKELEKFGFNEDENNINEGCSSKYASLDNYYRTLTKADKLSKNEIRVCVNIFSREINLLHLGGNGELEQTNDLIFLFDLITADLVEKVEEKPENSIYYDKSLYVETELVRQKLNELKGE